MSTTKLQFGLGQLTKELVLFFLVVFLDMGNKVNRTRRLQTEKVILIGDEIVL